MKSQVALAAAAIRKDLKARFPEIKFIVRSENYSGGNSVRVEYEDGPLSEDVSRVIGKYEYGSFNGMEDIYEYSNVRADIPQTKYLFVQRYMSDKTKKELTEKITSTYANCQGLKYEDYSEYWQAHIHTLCHRLFQEMDMYFVDFEAELLSR